MADGRPKRPRRQRLGIAIKHNDIGRHVGAVSQTQATHLAISGLYPFNMGLINKLCAACLGNLRQSLGKSVHPAFDRPDTRCLGLPDQRKQRR